MELVLILAALVVITLVALRRRPAWSAPETRDFDRSVFGDFERRDIFASGAERAFYLALDTALPKTARLLAKVRLEDVIGVRRDLPPKLRFARRGRVKSRHVDFVVVDLSGRVLCAVELDGPSHAGRPVADRFKDGLFAATHVPLHRISADADFHRAARDIARTLSRA